VRTTRRSQYALALAVLASTLGLSSSLAVGQASSSGTSLPRPTYNSNCEKTALSQVAMDQCVASELAQLGSEMHIALNDEATRFGKTAVTSAQDAWALFEKAECQLEESPYKGGTIQPLIYGVCERGLLVQRINDIDAVIRAAPH
jgi:uncharacterized protein YecT (DUF1311 family)